MKSSDIFNVDLFFMLLSLTAILGLYPHFLTIVFDRIRGIQLDLKVQVLPRVNIHRVG